MYNKSLCNMKLIPSPNCNICNEIETIQDRFYLCNSIQVFWKDLIYWWQQHTEIVIHLTMKDVIFGCYDINNIPLNFLYFAWKMFYPFNTYKITWQTSSVYCFQKLSEK